MRHAPCLIPCSALIMVLATSLVSSAQTLPWTTPGEPEVVRRELTRRLGPGWKMLWNEQTSRPSDLFGGAAEVVPVTDPLTPDPIETARSFIAGIADLLGIRADTIGAGRMIPLPLERVGLTRKTAVVFDQALMEVPVLGGGLTVLLDRRGRVVAVHNHLWPLAELRPALVPISLQHAIQIAFDDLGRPWAEVESARLSFVPLPPDRPRLAQTAYRIRVIDRGGGDRVPDGREVWVDEVSGEILQRLPMVYESDISGRVIGYATWGTRPDTLSNPPAPRPIGGVSIRSGDQLAITSGSGHWFLSAADDSRPVGVDLHGPWAEVISAQNPVSDSLSPTPGTVLTFLLNNPPDASGTSQINAHLAVWHLLNFLRTVDPADTTIDEAVSIEVNMPTPCQALWDGRRVLLGAAGDGCPNAAYSTVIAHELGHWLTTRFNPYTTQALAEGAADVWAMFLYDDPVVGRDFFGPGSSLRDNSELVTKCPVESPDCHGGDPHVDGQVLAGTFWSLRQGVVAAEGDAAGGALADALFLAWLKGFNDHDIDASLLAHLLVLDDDDGNLSNRTPHYDAIVTACADHGLPILGFDTIVVSHRPVAETQLASPVAIQAAVSTLDGSPLGTIELLYSINDGPFTTVGMRPSEPSGSYEAVIPPQTAPTTVRYFIRATGPGGASVTDPAQAPDQDSHIYHVGQVKSLYANNFDTPYEFGWAHEAVAGNDDWQREIPRGRGGDPAEAHTSNRCWGNNLAGDGIIAPGTVSSLRSPLMNLDGVHGTRLQFRRWLGVGPFPDQARITVNDATVWESPRETGLRDDHWTLQEIDIAGLADGKSEVTVRFWMTATAGGQACGWNIDDFRLVSVGPFDSPSCPITVHPGGTAGSGGLVPIIASRGQTTPGAGTFVVTGSQMLGGTFAALLVGGARSSLDLAGVTVEVDLTKPHTLLLTAVPGTGVADGQVELPVPIPERADLTGHPLFAQWLVFDPGAAEGVAASPLLEATICRQ